MENNTDKLAPQHKSLLKRTNFIVTSATLLMIVLLAVLLAMRHENSKKSTSKVKPSTPAIYAAQPLVKRTLQNLEYSLPEEALDYSRTDTQAEYFNHYKSPKTKKERVLYASVAYAAFDSAPPDAQLNSINANLQNPKYKDYNKTIKPIEDFARMRLPQKSSVTVSNGKQFNSPNISKNAWIFDLEANPSKVEGSVAKGKIIYLISGKDQYYFMLYSAKDDWSASLSKWQAVFNSIKII